MKPSLIFYPVCAQVLLTFTVWVTLYVTRIGEMVRKRIKTQTLADGEKMAALLKAVVNPSDNFENLFEIPVLFYVAMLVIFQAGLVDSFYLIAGWSFVGLRVLHSLIHCTYNRVMHRFLAYALSTMMVWLIWARIGYQLVALV